MFRFQNTYSNNILIKSICFKLMIIIENLQMQHLLMLKERRNEKCRLSKDLQLMNVLKYINDTSYSSNTNLKYIHTSYFLFYKKLIQIINYNDCYYIKIFY